MAKEKRLTIKQTDEILATSTYFSLILKQRVRRVRWLYNNGNKCAMVYDEKLVRLMIHRLKERINFLEQQREEYGI